MTQAQEIAAQLDKEWQLNENWIGQLATRTDAGWAIDGLLERRRWLHEAKRVAAEEVRKEIAI